MLLNSPPNLGESRNKPATTYCLSSIFFQRNVLKDVCDRPIFLFHQDDVTTQSVSSIVACYFAELGFQFVWQAFHFFLFIHRNASSYDKRPLDFRWKCRSIQGARRQGANDVLVIGCD